MTKKGNISLQNVSFPEKNKILEMLKTKIGLTSKVIVAISGGPDSMLTATLVQNFFVANKYDTKNIFFVHFNHKIRAESDQEEQFIKNYFKKTNLICISLSSNTLASLRKEEGAKRKEDLLPRKEENLRNRRYSEIQKLVKKFKINHVILGHNLSDRIESTFLNLLRGAGIKGFSSMEFCEPHHLLPGSKVLRPLINISKSEIENICKKNHIPYVIDASNYNDETSLRNKLRNKILPSLYALSKNQKAKETFENSMLNIYKEIEKFKIKSTSQGLQSSTAGDLGGLKSIAQSPYRKAKFAYQRDIPLKGITIENIIQLIDQLGIYNNISTALLNELLKFFTTADNGYKYFQKTYFFVAHGKIYIIQAPIDFRKKHIIGTITNHPNFRYPRANDRYKGKTRNQYCITQKIPLFRRNFVAVLETDGKISKVIKPI